MGTSTQQKTEGESSTTVPWSVQAPYIQQAFQGASNALTSANGAAAPSNFTAQYTPAMMQAFQSELGYGSGNSAIPGSSAAAGSALTGAGASAAASGLYGLQNYNQVGGTNYNIDAANQYANNPAISGEVNAAMRDANQQFTDVTNPAIMRNAAGTGNVNSTAPAIQQGIVERGLAQTAADTSAQLRGQAYTQGLNLAQTQAQNQNTNSLQALMAAASGGTSAASAGANANSAAIGQQGGLFDIANSGASNINAGNQADLTNQLQAWQFGTNSPFAALNNYFNIVGNKSFGSSKTGTGTSTTESTPSTLSLIGSGLGMAGSVLGS